MTPPIRPEPAEDLDSLIAARRKALTAAPTPAAPSEDLDALIAARRKAVQPEYTPGQQFGTAVAQGASLGFAPKILGGIDAADKYLHGDRNFAKNYTATRDRISGAEDAALQEHPIAGRLTELAGGALPAVAGAVMEGGLQAARGIAGKIAPKLSMADKIGNGIGHGTIIGAVSGAGHAKDSADDYADQIGQGGLLGAITGGAIPVAGAALGKAGSAALDYAGRPDNSRPLITSRFGGIGPTVEGINDRAARLNAGALQRGGVDINAMHATADQSGKPLAPVDMAGTPGQRVARGLKTAYSQAETIARAALEPRGEGAVERVINHGLETTGLVNRESGILTEHDLHQQATDQGNAAYPPVFAAKPEPISNPAHLEEANSILRTDAGQQALKRGMRIASNFRDPIGEIQKATGGTPPGYTPEQWAGITKTMAERGLPVPDVPSGETQLAPTLKQMHYIKLGFDDLLNGAPEPGSGGSGPVNAAATRQLKRQWLAVMDDHAPDYGAVRKQYADTKELERGAALGQQLFKMHPDQMKVEMQDLPENAQQMVRRTGFNALAERVEGGPENIDKGLKSIDRKRMRLLFPDDVSFERFQNGLKDEATMHASKLGVLGGSNTADKLADMADMAGVSLPDVLDAVTKPAGFIGRQVGKMAEQSRTAAAGKLAAERMRLLVAGADGNAGVRTDALTRMGGPPPGASALMDAVAGNAPRDRRPAPMKRLPPARWDSGDMQGPPIPSAGDLAPGTRRLPSSPALIPESRRLQSGPPVVDGPQQGPAIPQPSYRATPTAGTVRQGPGLALGGKTLDQQVQEEVQKIYRRNPQMAVSLSREQQQRLEALVHAKLTGAEPPPPTAPTFDFRRAIGLGSP